MHEGQLSLHDAVLHAEGQPNPEWANKKELALEAVNLTIGLAIAIPASFYWLLEDRARQVFRYLPLH